MDAFYVEVERRRDNTLRGIPVVVGGLGPRGVVSSASYEARRRGVHSAMPIVHARRLCPDARFVPPDHRAYRDVSRQVFTLLMEVTPRVEGVSIDEAFLDVAGLHRHFGCVDAIASRVRAGLRSHLGLPASVGMARTKFLAKLASSLAKPDGQLHVAATDEDTFLRPLPIERLWGVGEATRAGLERLGLVTVGDLADVPLEVLRARLGFAVGDHLWRLTHGIDPRTVERGQAAKSISAEHTFPSDLERSDDVERELLRLSEAVGLRLRRAARRAKTVTVKVRFADFATKTRSRTLADPVDGCADIYRIAVELAGTAGDGPIRLLGVAGSRLVESADPRQLELGCPHTDPLTAAADRIRERFGDGAVTQARLVGIDRAE